MTANGKCVAYYRVSTKSQGASGLGLEAQQASVNRFVQHGSMTLLASYTDLETGTRKGNDRPQLKAAIAHAKREKATLLLAKLDRLARNVHFVTGLMEAGCDFVAVDMPHASRITVQIMAVMAEHEAEMISRRTKEALAACKARGVRLGCPVAIAKHVQKLGAAATHAKAVKDYGHLSHRIVAMRASGMTFAAISRQINGEGHHTRTGACFQDVTIKRIWRRASGNCGTPNQD